ncbi:MAG: hypothetical protein AAF488_09615 [Planctomycetota bacterium]
MPSMNGLAGASPEGVAGGTARCFETRSWGVSGAAVAGNSRLGASTMIAAANNQGTTLPAPIRTTDGAPEGVGAESAIGAESAVGTMVVEDVLRSDSIRWSGSDGFAGLLRSALGCRMGLLTSLNSSTAS